MIPNGRTLGWIFSGAVAAWSVAIFWIGLHRETVIRTVFRAPPTAVEVRGKAVEIPAIEMPPPLPLPTSLDPHLPAAPALPPPVRGK